MDIRILDLFQKSWEKFPEVPFLEMIGSCFAAGDLSHISDDELLKNLVVLLEMEREERVRKVG